MSEATAQTMFPCLCYRDARGAIAWLEAAFGARAVLVVPGEGDDVAHAEVRVGDAVVMLGTVSEPGGGRVHWPAGAGCVYVVVGAGELDAHFARASAAHGTRVVRAVADTGYGTRDYVVRDPEGVLWSVGTYRPEA